MLDLALSLDTELKEAVRIADEAGEILRQARLGSLKTKRKADNSIVTEADLASDELISSELRRLFPADGILSEESAYVRGESGRTWVIDPLDGTSGYANGGDDYAVQIGLIADGKPVLGVVAEPETRRIYRAINGVGTFMSSDATSTMRQLRVSKAQDLADMALVVSARFPRDNVQHLSEVLKVNSVIQAPSVGCKVGKLTRREVDLYYSVHPVSYWDSCAPLVVLEAAGGMMTSPDGSALSYDFNQTNFQHSTPLVASNGHIHSACCEKIREYMAANAS